MAEPRVSICIPTCKKPDFVLRCLQSISRQNYTNIEVIISDDSPDETIRQVIEGFPQLAIRYYHNKSPLKSPLNWNAAIDKASGDLFMLLHQDDWLQTPGSISHFVTPFSNPETDIAFCKNIGMDMEGNTILFQDKDTIRNLKKCPEYLLIRNIIGPPSNMMLRKSVTVRYDEKLVWLVDVDYYLQIIKKGFRYHYINEHLVTIGIHSDQTTEAVRSDNTLVFKENMLVAKKLEDAAFKNIALYDYYWRLIRNLKIRSVKEVDFFGIPGNDLPFIIKNMIHFQKKIPAYMLNTGMVSKSLMLVSYLKWRTLNK